MRAKILELKKRGDDLVTIHDFQNGRIIRKATKKEFERYNMELKMRSKEEKLSGEVTGKPFGIRGLIYMQDYPIGGFDDEE